LASLVTESETEVKETESETKEMPKQLTKEELRAARLAFLDKPKTGS